MDNMSIACNMYPEKKNIVVNQKWQSYNNPTTFDYPIVLPMKKKELIKIQKVRVINDLKHLTKYLTFCSMAQQSTT